MGYRQLVETSLYLWVWCLCLPLSFNAQSTYMSPLNTENFKFSYNLYNVSIRENSYGKTYVTSYEKMGIPIYNSILDNLELKYTIEGDGHEIFKAEEHFVGDFCFLRVRTSTRMTTNINREARSQYHLRVSATARYADSNEVPVQLKTSADLIVNVLDENDLSPLFDRNFYSVDVPEDTPLHSSIAQVSASDADTGINGEVYFRFAKRTNQFAIHPTSGIVTLTHHLKYSFQTVYILEIYASDRGPLFRKSPKPSVHTRLEITVMPVNYHAPNIKVQNHPSIIEHGNLGSVYAILMITDPDDSANGHIASVDIVDGNPDNMFKIVRGAELNLYNIVVMGGLDRETSPYGYNLTIEAIDHGTPPKATKTKVSVRIQDTNDNEPRFKQELYETSISEIVPINTPVIIVDAIDSDWGKNSEVVYTVVGGNQDNLFKISEQSGLISTNSFLDADKIDGVVLIIHAEDQANSGARKFSETKVKINFLDYNDNWPVFDKSKYEGKVEEDQPEGTSVLTITAHDKDSGDNGTIIYSIPNSHLLPFEIDQFSGKIKTNAILDYETMANEFKITVRASDMGVPFRREVETIVSIKLQNINDNSPEFEAVNCTGFMLQEIAKGTQITVLTAIDMDAVDVISYRIIDGNRLNCFGIEPSTGAIFLKCDLSHYPDVNSFSFMVAATDDKHFSKPTTINMTVMKSKQDLPHDISITCTETDVKKRLEENYQLQTSSRNLHMNDVSPTPETLPANDHSPEFKANIPTYIEVQEDLEVGSTITMLQADDPDSGYNGKLVYGIAKGNKLGAFKMDTFSGALKLMSSLDRETTASYQLVITVFDLGFPSKNMTTTLRIGVSDVNDNKPVFEKESYEVNISEDQLINTTVISIRAKDADLGPNSRIHYSILTDTQKFNIDPTGGIIRVNQPLDREQQSVHKVKVQAEDSGTAIKLASQIQVVITLDDVNDNTPNFVPSNYMVKVREDLPIGALVTILTAEDLDSGKNGRITYTIQHGADGKFEIDAETGVVRIAGTLDYEDKQLYNVSARAEDGGNPPLATGCLINIEIVDVNENYIPPKFDNYVVEGQVRENEKIGTYVMTVLAKDDDGIPGKDPIIYSIRDGSGLGRFTIDDNGAIRTTQVLDRETTSHYWLAVYAQDRSLVPQSSRLEVLINVVDVNDNVPMSVEPGYYTSVAEGETNRNIVTIQAIDYDYNPNERLYFKITGGNPQNFFQIHETDGTISTTSRKLDREAQEEHALEVTISDNGRPVLQSTTRVIVKVTDINDNKPRFLQHVQKAYIRVLESTSSSAKPIYRVLAKDKDEGPNSFITYTLGKQKNLPFSVDSSTGNIYAISGLITDRTYDLNVKATDHGSPPRKSQTRVYISVISRPTRSQSPPQFQQNKYHAFVTENDIVGHLVTDVTATDDNDKLWYSIEGGNENHTFTILPSTGTILLARTVNWEKKSSYNLTVCATDGIHTNCTSVYVKVIDVNDNEPVFSQNTYLAEISESAKVGQSVLKLSATDADEDNRVFFTIISAANLISQKLFKIDETQGVIKVADSLDREALSRHILTVMVNDLGTPTKRSYARVKITVLDHNDHNPEFLSSVFSGRVYETSAVGTSVVELIATDKDKGDNAEITYTIIAGNAGGTFSLDGKLGLVSVAKELNRHNQEGYQLTVSATDHGTPPRSSTATVNIHVTISNNSPPKFAKREYMAELEENRPIGSIVLALQAVSQSSVVYHIIPSPADAFFTINPNSGVISSRREIDYETNQFFNFTVTATNMVEAKSEVNIVIHILDINDNHPVFLKSVYIGEIRESAPINSLVTDKAKSPLVVQAKDDDYDANALLRYEISDNEAKNYFTIDLNTGTLRTITGLDHETISMFNFTIHVYDGGKPSLQAITPATVIINVLDVNDSPPRFPTHTHMAKVLLPTYKDITVIELKASDPDGRENDMLTYSIVGGNDRNKFAINPQTGVITIQDETNMNPNYNLRVMVSDGKFQTTANILVTVEKSVDSGLKFTQDTYTVHHGENLKKIESLIIVQPVGHSINEHFTFHLLNNHDKFTVGLTSGVVYTKGVAFDRELKDNYTVVVAVEDSKTPPRYAHVVVNVLINDENDNTPMFLNQPYYSAVSVESKEGDVIKKVMAIDKDIGENGRITYRLITSETDKFAINQYTGEIVVQKLTIDDENSVVMLTVEARDNGNPSRQAEAVVPINIVSSSSPMFDKQFYNISVLENIGLYTPVTSIHAVNPSNKKLIYSINNGNDQGAFAVDFNTGLISVMGELDYETRKEDNLTLRATDVYTGNYAETRVLLYLKDVNDNAPVFKSMIYTDAVSEALIVGSSILTVSADDADSGMNKIISYSLAPNEMHSHDVDHFHINYGTGDIFLHKRLDSEIQKDFRFLAVATDAGMPALSSTALVHIMVLDTNDNAPKFTQISYDCKITDQAQRGQLVTRLLAIDDDTTDANNLVYSIVDGNEKQTFSIHSSTGLVSVSEQRKPIFQPIHTLNVSVTDTVYTSYTRLTITVVNTNKITPHFSQLDYNVEFAENQAVGSLVGVVSADDEDRGDYGLLTYSIISDVMKEIFQIDADTGEVFSKSILDREERSKYDVSIAATDNGGKMNYTTLHITVTDENDNLPLFVIKEYKANVYSDATIDTEILKIQAVDLDEGSNGNIIYSIYQEDDPDINNIFTINSHTGSLTVKSTLIEKENAVYQFFIRAKDEGGLPLENHVPVEILILGHEETPPTFDQPNYAFFIGEDAKVGNTIATLKAEGVDLIYSIVAGNTRATNVPPKFSINESGQINIIEELDREAVDTFTLTVRAETQTSPALVGNTEVVITLRDVNDNVPIIQSNPYFITVVENAVPGTRLLQVKADDKDEESYLEYRFGPATAEITNVFSIDAESGWITSLTLLDREEQDEYNITIIVIDKSGEITHTATSFVIITVTDFNDNPPKFERSQYKSTVNEDAEADIIFLSVKATDIDFGQNSEITYYIVNGDKLGQFDVNRNGDVFVTKRSLDRESKHHYGLTIAATDGAFVSYSTVEIDILDANDNTPICTKLMYVIFEQEDVPVGYKIKSEQIQATDADDPETRNSHIEYFLSGDGADSFDLDKTTGTLTTAKELDRETQAKYYLLAKAVDGGGLSCTSEVNIYINDVNDNAPEFTLTENIFSIHEDARINTLVTRVTATDKDIGVNRKIIYGIVGEAKTIFNIGSNSGVISLIRPLDRELTAEHNITVTAKNLGPQPLFTSTVLRVLVLDVNDNEPEFERTSYYVMVEENAPLSSSIIQVTATSLDIGQNANITYSIVAGNEQNKFSIHSTTGVVNVNEPLDYELSREYFITILARDHGTPPLSNTAIININITDINDNKPRFSQTSYSISIREDMPANGEVMKIIATDDDGELNNKLTYRIATGDPYDQFSINHQNGSLHIQKELDREMIQTYILEIEVRDSGMPVLSSSTLVNIIVLDANDNAPLFTQPNYTAYIQEGSKAGIQILKLTVTDDDESQNGGPFSFDIINGNDGKEFHINADGVLLTSGNELKKKVKEMYTLTVRAFDKGTPVLFSDAHIEIHVVDESMYPPEVRNLSISISSYLDKFLGGEIGKVEAFDSDPYDVLIYNIVSPNRHLFEIHKADGRILAKPGLDAGTYQVNVSISDGKFFSHSLVKVDVMAISVEMMDSSVTIQFDNMFPEQFYASYMKEFKRVLKKELNVRGKDIEIINVQSSNKSILKRTHKRSLSNNLDVLFAVKKSTGKYFNKNSLRRKVERARDAIETGMNVRVEKVFNDICVRSMCETGTCVSHLVFNDDNLIPVTVGDESFVSATHRYVYYCNCTDGTCLGVVCGDKKCPAHQVCHKTNKNRFSCRCPDGKTGVTCADNLHPLSVCSDASCSKGNRPMTFNGRSYARWTLTETTAERLTMSMRFRTRKSDCNLMYTKGRVDYSILEIKDNNLQYRFNCGSGEGFVTVPVDVSDGQWHIIMVERNGRIAELYLDHGYKAISSAPGINDKLNLDSMDVYFGAEVTVFPEGYHDIKKGFEGCIEGIRMFNILLPFTGTNRVAVTQKFQDVEFKCKDYKPAPIGNICSSHPCMNGGTCHYRQYNTYICNCKPRFQGRKCEIDSNSCQDNPCFNKGICVLDKNVINGFTCTCPDDLKGKQCEYGIYCKPDTCKNGGKCIEGRNAPLCHCTSKYEGLYCEKLVDQCIVNPCENGGTCINRGEDYECSCTRDRAGHHCEEIITISSSIKISLHLIYIFIAIAVAVILFVVIVVIICCVCKRRRRKNRRRCGRSSPGETVRMLDDKRSNKKLSGEDIRMNRYPSSPPPVPDRPVSYTPSNHDSMNTLNNFDTVGNYGSAADGLQRMGLHNIHSFTPADVYTHKFGTPPATQKHYYSTFQSPPSNPASDTDSIQKDPQEYEYPNFMENYPVEKKHQDKMTMKLLPGMSPKVIRNALARQDASSVSSLPVSESEDDLNGYHWDTSDWAPKPNLPNISELPSAEVPDSPCSSAHSNDSNTHVDLGVESDYNGNESEYVGDSEFAEEGEDNEHPPPEYDEYPNYQRILNIPDVEVEEYQLPTNLQHMTPDLYLPGFDINGSNDQEAFLDHFTDVDSHPFSNDGDNNSVIKVQLTQPWQQHYFSQLSDYNTDNERSSLSLMDDNSVSMGGNLSRNNSCSDISGLCDFEDSEINASESEDDGATSRLLQPSLHSRV
ncbi:hypothetical protein SNE40_016628 [Patella caerulea]|uniref:Protocadherin Fat 1 n=2 Tax=Patella caerulea TaxID=87958 RepID=A0AAN8JC90_PATCE